MALAPVNIYLANSRYTYTLNKQSYCDGFADIFNIHSNGVDIMYELLKQINNGDYGLIFKEGLIAIFDEYKDEDGNDRNNDNYQFFRIFEHIEGYNENDYISKGKDTGGFGFIEIRTVLL